MPGGEGMKQPRKIVLYGISIYSLDSLKRQLLIKFNLRAYNLVNFESRLRARIERRNEEVVLIWNSLSDSLTGIKGDMEGPKNDFILVDGNPMLSDAINGRSKLPKENEQLNQLAQERLNELKSFIEELNLFEIVYK